MKPGEQYSARINAYDFEGDTLSVDWNVIPDVNERLVIPQKRTAPEPITGSIVQVQGTKALLRAPSQTGPYRLVVIAHDKHGSVATHSFPFYVGSRPKAKE